MSEVVFEDYGVRIVREATGLVVEYDSGESAGSHLVRKRLTEEQARRAMQGEAAAYAVLIELEREAEVP